MRNALRSKYDGVDAIKYAVLQSFFSLLFVTRDSDVIL